MFNHIFEGDHWTEVNTCVMTAANFVCVYYCFSNSINICFDLELMSKDEYYVISASLLLALLATYGPVYCIRKGNIHFQSFAPNGISSSVDSSLDEPLLNTRVKLTNHERFILFGIGTIQICNAIFPFLFLINSLIKEKVPYAAKISLVIGATLLGSLSSVAPIRTARKTLLGTNL